MKKKIAWIFITGVIIFAWIAVAITPTPTYPIHIVSDTIVEATREAVIDGNVFENFTVEWIVDTIYPLPDPTIIDTFKAE